MPLRLANVSFSEDISRNPRTNSLTFDGLEQCSYAGYGDIRWFDLSCTALDGASPGLDRLHGAQMVCEDDSRSLLALGGRHRSFAAAGAGCCCRRVRISGRAAPLVLLCPDTTHLPYILPPPPNRLKLYCSLCFYTFETSSHPSLQPFSPVVFCVHPTSPSPLPFAVRVYVPQFAPVCSPAAKSTHTPEMAEGTCARRMFAMLVST